MAFWHVVWSRIGALRRSGRADQDLTDELDSFVADRTERHRQAGLSAEAARRAALLEVGGMERVKEDVRDVRPGRRWTAAIRDARHGLRLLRRSSGFSAALVLILALGVGANGAVFSILRAVLLQPLPYRDPGRVVMVWTTPVKPPAPTNLLQPQTLHRTPPNEAAIAIHDRAADALISATYLSWQGNLEAQLDLTLADRAERIRGILATPNFFDVLGASAAHGRLFTAADESAHEPLVVIGDALWRRDFGADPGVVGRSVTFVSGRPRQPRAFTVIGVLPAGFRFTYPEETEVFSLYAWPSVRSVIGGTGYWTVARLTDGTTLDAAQTRVRAIPVTAYGRPLPVDSQEVFELQPIADWVAGQARPAMMLLGAVALVLLLITCATVASALFIRTTERQRELAVRAAMGAERGRLVRQLLTEGIVLSLTGAAAGTGVAMLLAPVLRAIVPATVPRGDEITVDGWMLAFFAGAAGCVTVLAALAPAWRGTRIDVVSILKRTSTAASADWSTARWRQGLVAAQAMMSTSLLLAAALLLVSYYRLSHVPLGFDGSRVLTVEMRLLGPQYAAPRPSGPPAGKPAISPALQSFETRLLEGVRALPGVLDAGVTSAVPFRGVDFTFVLNETGSSRTVPANARFVDAGYFGVMRIPPIRGRTFDQSDSATGPRVLVVSESFARQLFGTTDPLGHMVDLIAGNAEVIGVVGDVRYKAYEKDAAPAIYIPVSQSPNLLICLVARMAPNAGDLAPAVRHIIRELDPDLPAMNLTTIDEILSTSVADRRFFTTATASFAAVALALTIAGLVVIVSRAVVERRRELAIRTALGASSGRLMATVVRQGLTPIVIGAALGLAVVAAGSRILEQFLFQVAPRDPRAFALVAVVVGTVALIATIVPARRATRIAPASLLRSE